MDVKEAIGAAKAHIADKFAGEDVEQIGLEEIRLDEVGEHWLITVGFARVPQGLGALARAGMGLRADGDARRLYKVVKLRRDDGAFVAILNRTPAADVA